MQVLVPQHFNAKAGDAQVLANSRHLASVNKMTPPNVYIGATAAHEAVPSPQNQYERRQYETRL
jgi:hypothetical protein